MQSSTPDSGVLLVLLASSVLEIVTYQYDYRLFPLAIIHLSIESTSTLSFAIQQA